MLLVSGNPQVGLPLFVFNNLKEEYDRQIQISKPDSSPQRDCC